MATTGHAMWTGGLRDGDGVIDTGSGAVSGLRYSAGSRFEGENGSNPEELQGAGANDQHGHRPRGRRAAPAR